MSKLIVANWKCNPKTKKEAINLFNKVKSTRAVICPPLIYLPLFNYAFLGAQNCHWQDSGAYTGEVSPAMLKDLGVKYVILGHSERREYFNETDEIINKKLKAVLDAGLIPILCIGEKKGEDANLVVENQLSCDLNGISEKDRDKIIIAYEPVWAIGTGDFCPPGKAQKALEFIKRKLGNKILYGGSVNSKIAGDYIKTGFDGLLVGGASLDAKEFIEIVKNA